MLRVGLCYLRLLHSKAIDSHADENSSKNNAVFFDRDPILCIQVMDILQKLDESGKDQKLQIIYYLCPNATYPVFHSETAVLYSAVDKAPVDPLRAPRV